jgi:hypothetical protein
MLFQSNLAGYQKYLSPWSTRKNCCAKGLPVVVAIVVAVDTVVDVKAVVDTDLVVGLERQRLGFFILPLTQVSVPKGLLRVATCGFHKRTDPS